MNKKTFKKFKKYVKENTAFVVPYEYPVVLEWDKDNDITDILPKERCNPDVMGNQYKCVQCEEMYLYFADYINHMKEDYNIDNPDEPIKIEEEKYEFVSEE